MFGLSTAWNARKHDDARPMVEEIKNLGIDHIELNFTLSGKMVAGVTKLVDEGAVKVTSLHNFCPVPEDVDIKEASPDYYSLSSIEEGERKRAVKETKHTIEAARRLKAEAVVIHAGRLNMSGKTRQLAAAIESGIDTASMVNGMRHERQDELKKGYLEALLKSIDELSLYSKGRGIKIGLENRFYFHELPSIEEFEVIFARFPADTNVYYWHDTGHAQVFENLGLTPHRKYLDKLSSRLLGVHLHDIKGIIGDHRAPLTGDFDFTLLKPYLGKTVLKVMEPHAAATSDEIKKAFTYLKGLYGEEE